MTEAELGEKKNLKIEEARAARNERRFLDEIRCCKEIVDLGLSFSLEEIRLISFACTQLPEQLTAEELRMCPIENLVEHATAVVQIVDQLVPTLEPRLVQSFLKDRWNSCHVRQKHGHPDSTNTIAIQNIQLARTGFVRLSLGHSKRISKIRFWILHLENSADEREEIAKLIHEIESAEEEDPTMTEKQQAKSIRLLSELKTDLEFLDEKEQTLAAAGLAGKGRRFLEQLQLWQQVLDLNVALTLQERKEFNRVSQPLSKKLPIYEFRKLKDEEVIEHAEAVINMLDQFIGRPMLHGKNEKFVLLRARWENDEELQKRRDGRVDYDALAEEYVVRTKETIGFWFADASTIPELLFFLAKLPTQERRLDVLGALRTEVMIFANNLQARGISPQPLEATLKELARVRELIHSDGQPTVSQNGGYQESSTRPEKEQNQAEKNTPCPLDKSSAQPDRAADFPAKLQMDSNRRTRLFDFDFSSTVLVISLLILLIGMMIAFFLMRAQPAPPHDALSCFCDSLEADLREIKAINELALIEARSAIHRVVYEQLQKLKKPVLPRE